jgi:NlpC/P60 family putative phage cell wall peptidase
VRGIWRELYGTEPEPLLAYTRDWAEAQGRETLLEAARRHLVEVPATDAHPGDVLILRWRRTVPAKHCAILATPATMIHALEGVPVSEVSLSPWWRRHLAGVFAFPETNK